jgi:hypothetical protein
MIASLARQRGAALLALLLVIALGGMWYLTTRLSAASGEVKAANQRYNAEVLGRVKKALIGHVVLQATKQGETDPGRLPCPEAAGNIGTGLDGATAGTCMSSPPAIGRFPWRTVGIEMPRDASGEPLWYVVASGWALGSNLVINSNCTSDLTMACNSGLLKVDGVQDTVALIIAPGQAMNVAASAGCTARAQARSTPSPTTNALDYLECYNAATVPPTFVTTGPGDSFNDQVVKITAAELLPAIEAAMADRVTHDIGPQMRTAYSGGLWPATPVLPYAVPFSDPTNSPGNKLQGSAGTLQGLMPASYAFSGGCSCDAPNTPPCPCSVNSQGQRSLEPCTAAGNPRCDPAFVSWRASSPCGAATCTTLTRTSGGNLDSYTCTVSGTPSTLTCTANVWTDIFGFFLGNYGLTFNLDATASNVGMSWRQVSNPTASSRAPQITGIDFGYVTSPIGYSVTSATMNTDGSATARINAQFAAGSGSILGALGAITCSFFGIPLCYQYTLSVPMAIFADHPLVDPTNSNYSWIYRNKWHEVAYYTVAPGIAPSGARSCTTGLDCLQLAYDSNNYNRRGIIILGGQKLGTQNRPALTASDLLEGANADGTSPFEVRSAGTLVNRSFNDRFGVVDSN